jgi:hypothetical protein
MREMRQVLLALQRSTVGVFGGLYMEGVSASNVPAIDISVFEPVGVRDKLSTCAALNAGTHDVNANNNIEIKFLGLYIVFLIYLR